MIKVSVGQNDGFRWMLAKQVKLRESRAHGLPRSEARVDEQCAFLEKIEVGAGPHLVRPADAKKVHGVLLTRGNCSRRKIQARTRGNGGHQVGSWREFQSS